MIAEYEPSLEDAMHVALTAEQRAFAEASASLGADLASRWDRGRGPTDVAVPTPPDRDWATIVEAGWPALHLSEGNGGLGASTLDVAVLVEQLGRHAVPAPIIGTILAVEQLQAYGAPSSILTETAEGGLRIAPLLSSDLTGFAATTADAVAWDGAGAQLAYAADGTAVTLGDAVPAVDITRLARQLDSTPTGDRLSLQTPGSDEADRLLAFVLTILVADLLGTMSAALDAAVEHASSRTQFGARIGSFQALQAIAAEDLVSVEATRSALYYSAWAVDTLSGPNALVAARTAKSFGSRAAITVCEDAIQIFGGMGMTWECPAHMWLRRAHTDRRLFGNEHHHQAILADHDLNPRD